MKIATILYRSPIGRSYRQKRVVEGLGLRKVGQKTIHEDGPSIRGMVAKVPHLVRIEEVEESNNG